MQFLKNIELSLLQELSIIKKEIQEKTIIERTKLIIFLKNIELTLFLE